MERRLTTLPPSNTDHGNNGGKLIMQIAMQQRKMKVQHLINLRFISTTKLTMLQQPAADTTFLVDTNRDFRYFVYNYK
jgi:hypothetical protein